jgi:hypothetical protein
MKFAKRRLKVNCVGHQNGNSLAGVLTVATHEVSPAASNWRMLFWVEI